MGETDIKRVAKELQQLILPDISQLIVGQIPEIQSIVDGAIKSAVSQINSTLLKEVNSVKRENIELKQTVDDLEQKVARLDRAIDDENSTVEEIAFAYQVYQSLQRKTRIRLY